ncbi:ADP-ribosylation factor-like protein 9 isoform X2 [Electrophorus electricus]|uniref:ADP-ribosylation factor-like protein 9 isoform X2 n=1 Tax=Electrophorus electricus TaxID=8005 RepID=UPI0015D001F9|nr:ADP-ribosylation factor-like protein 9 isoform X2 [Electrophorus electricus]
MVSLRHISVAFTAAVTAVGAALFVALNLIYKRRVWPPEDYYVFKEEEEERRERQVLVLGLDGAGKSSVLQGLSGGAGKRHCRPTRGFNFIRLHTPACQLDFLEIGGGEELRAYWPEFLRKTHILVYVVDSSDRSRLPQAKDELHRLLRVDTQLPVVVLGNKQPLLFRTSRMRPTCMNCVTRSPWAHWQSRGGSTSSCSSWARQGPSVPTASRTCKMCC